MRWRQADLNRRQAIGLIAAAAVAWPVRAHAADQWPARTVRLVVPALGSPTDVHGRIFAEMLGERLGQRVLVDNKPGAAGNLGMQAAVVAPADGYTFVFAIASYITTNPFMYKKLLYDTERDFVPVSLLSKAGFTFVVREGLGIKTLADLTAYIKANPTKLSVANIQPGSLVHLAFESYLRTFGGSVELIPYKTSAQVLQDLWGGLVDLYPGPIGSTRQFEGNGKARAIAVTTIERHPSLPEVPTMAEQGMPAFDFYGWYGIFASRKTPPAIVERMNQEANAVVASKEYREKMIGLGAIPVEPMSPHDFKKLYLDEMAQLGPLIKSMNLVIE
ncbi:MAG TPA: tripartite tricarboxylate transporter substrate binding protein [Bradyrhizobium sp.]|jgi:tripartite-type tricarboxylate transporter receptor subunit TctC|nr:tripartite tricarboxylate transporter substrate binding protein [Bradyrhizobium sp.]